MINIIGIGPGDVIYLTYEAMEKIEHAQHLFGTERQLQCVHSCLEIFDRGQSDIIFHAYEGKLSTLKHQIETLLNARADVAILASGDPNFYGIVTWIRRMFPKESIVTTMGISSAQCLFNRTALPMHDVFMTSVHGREPNFDLWILLPKVCLLTDGKWNPFTLAKHYRSKGLNPKFYIGESLTYPAERITICNANEVEERAYTMCVLVIDHER